MDQDLQERAAAAAAPSVASGADLFPGGAGLHLVDLVQPVEQVVVHARDELAAGRFARRRPPGSDV
ncbi:hypothetical protein EYF80_012544 [Liparis tanakae]|uniref:Uncharacterized protein n=1 Tax=Liparis tanakae TaxID=230148 RepID=A0A4Z2IHF6_9TELE|nr:hypothetical protein EYF80_012544 [Liparis tanakae]